MVLKWLFIHKAIELVNISFKTYRKEAAYSGWIMLLFFWRQKRLRMHFLLKKTRYFCYRIRS